MPRTFIAFISLVLLLLLTTFPTDAHSEQRYGRMQNDSVSKIQQIQIAFLNYTNDNGGRYPPADNFRSSDKQPTLSWRVTLLPYLGYDKLFGEFKSGEAWDSPHNKAVLERHPLPTCYASPGTDSEKTKSTYFQVFACSKDAKPASFLSRGRFNTRAGITDGVTKTLAVVEAGPAVPWTKPDDLLFDPTKPLPTLISPTGSDFVYGVLVNGTVGKISTSLEEAKLRALITVNGDETIDMGQAFPPVKTIEDLKNNPPPKAVKPPVSKPETPDQAFERHKSWANFFVWMACLSPVIVLIPFGIYWYIKKNKPPPPKKKKKLKPKQSD